MQSATKAASLDRVRVKLEEMNDQLSGRIIVGNNNLVWIQHADKLNYEVDSDRIYNNYVPIINIPPIAKVVHIRSTWLYLVLLDIDGYLWYYYMKKLTKVLSYPVKSARIDDIMSLRLSIIDMNGTLSQCNLNSLMCGEVTEDSIKCIDDNVRSIEYVNCCWIKTYNNGRVNNEYDTITLSSPIRLSANNIVVTENDEVLAIVNACCGEVGQWGRNVVMTDLINHPMGRIIGLAFHRSSTLLMLDESGKIGIFRESITNTDTIYMESYKFSAIHPISSTVIGRRLISIGNYSTCVEDMDGILHRLYDYDGVLDLPCKLIGYSVEN